MTKAMSMEFHTINDPAELYEQHGFDGLRHVECANYEGSLHACTCGQLFMEKSELAEHIAEGMRYPDQLLEDWLAAAYSVYTVSTRDLISSSTR
jgi:hypothetical protein